MSADAARQPILLPAGAPEKEALAELLVDLAFQAREFAYVPYSRFSVGAAVLDDLGRIYFAGNVENASYGATCCAERIAIFKAISEGAKGIAALAVVTDAAGYARPCGICRQVIKEFATEDFRLYAAETRRRWLEETMEDILPNAFGPESLRAAKE